MGLKRESYSPHPPLTGYFVGAPGPQHFPPELFCEVTSLVKLRGVSLKTYLKRLPPLPSALGAPPNLSEELYVSMFLESNRIEKSGDV